jgi:ElaB/YqjD/DUF883 family membrane-anchored ribosome-binding protein
MAQRAESLCADESLHRRAAVIPLRAERESAFTKAKHEVERAYRQTQFTAMDTYSRLNTKLRELKATTRSRARGACNEQPLKVVAVAAGVAFALGFALRVWRSRS